jgi:hypothetical protein
MKVDLKVDPNAGEFARLMDDDARQESAMLAAVTSPVGLLLGVVGSVVAVVQGIAGFLLPFAIIATLIGVLDWSDLRVVLAWVVAG